MVERTVIWTATAEIQFENTLRFWSAKTNSNSFSIKLNETVDSYIKSILQSPNLFKASKFRNVRAATIEHFTLYYKNELENLIIVAFWDNRQNPKKLWKILNGKQ